VTDIHRLVARERRQSDAAAEMLALLRRLEWSGHGGWEGEDATCPSCDGFRDEVKVSGLPSREHGHRPGCRLAATLARHTRPERRPTQAECHPDRPVRARGLCRSCWGKAERAGTLARHARKAVTEGDVRSILAALGEFTTSEAAAALDISTEAVRPWLRRYAERLTSPTKAEPECRWRWTDSLRSGVSTGDSPAAGPSRAQRVASRDQPSRRGV
jgi:hypothetical protein